MRSLRLYFQNINTLKIGQGRKETEESFKRLSASGVSITLLIEVNKNMEMEEFMAKIRQVGQSGIQQALCRGGGNHRFDTDRWVKPGGEMAVVEKHIEELVKRVDVDEKGRRAHFFGVHSLWTLEKCTMSLLRSKIRGGGSKKFRNWWEKKHYVTPVTGGGLSPHMRGGVCDF